MTGFDPETDEVSLHDAAIIYRAGRWRRLEARTLDAFAVGVDGAALAEAAALFKVARLFPGEKGSKDKRAGLLAPIAPMLEEAAQGLTAENLTVRVQELSDRLKAQPKLVRISDKDKPFSTISPCSKFLWCMRPEIGIIYDERAREALSRKQSKVSLGDYSGFVEAFREEFRRRGAELDEVLPLLGALADRPWMKAKLLDFWLYTNGKLAAEVR